MHNPRRTSKLPYAGKVHKVYGSGEVIAALDTLGRLESKSRSEIIIQLVSAHLRKKAAKMRKAGLPIPAEVFLK